MSNHAEFRFLPWVRGGYRPSTTDPLDGPVADPSEFTIRLTPEAEGEGGATSSTVEETVDVRMYGPGDVLGFDQRQVVRIEPEPETADFTPNYFPVIEFDRPDLPWLFSPAAATTEGKLRPWLTLVVVRQQDGVSLTTGTRREAPILEIHGDADPATELPELRESWAWAHAQVVGAPDSGATEATWVTEELGRNSTQTVSRLVAPRRLQPGESYIACVVPTFEPGRRAGLGLDPYPDTGDGESGADREVAPAWDLDDPPGQLQLPVYYSWEFQTGPAGDFEALVRRLEPTELTSVGFRAVDASRPGPNGLADYRPTDVRVEGALRSVGLDHVAYPSSNRERLAEFLGRGDVDASPPTFGPPAYGQRHADVDDLPDAPSSGNDPWLRELNVDPRHRIVVGYGTQVVQHEQEALMQSAWAQIGDVRRANQLLARGQLAREASGHVHDDLSELPTAELLAVTSPTHARVLDDDGETVHRTVDDSRVPTGALSRSFRRLTRPGGPLGTRLATAGDANPLSPDLVLETFDAETTTSSGEPERFLVETEDAPDGTVTVEESDRPADDVTDHCRTLNKRLSGMGDPWPPAWETSLDGDAFLKAIAHECRVAARTLAGLQNRLAEHPDRSPRLRAVLERLRTACDCLCERERQAYERALSADDAHGQVATLANGIGCYEDAMRALAELEDALADADLADAHEQSLERLRSSCDELATVLRRRAYEHLRTDFCALSVGAFERVSDRVSDAKPPAPMLVDRLSRVCDLLCSLDSGDGGLVAELDAWIHSGGTYAHRVTAQLVRELRRLLAVAERVLVRLGDAVEESVAAEVAEIDALCIDFTVLVEFVGDGVGSPTNPAGVRVRDLLCEQRPPFPSPTPGDRLGDPTYADPLHALGETVTTALDPAVTIEARLAGRIPGLDTTREDALDPIMAAPTFPQPMYESLRDLDVEHFLPGVGDVPPDSLGLLETNPEFVEAHLVGLNHEMARELNWREYPTDRRGTYFKRFWDRRGAVPPKTGPDLDDIGDIHDWPIGSGATDLGENLLGGGDTSDAVVLVRGELLRRYPNTIVYAVKAERPDDRRQPILTDADTAPPPGTPGVEYPVFRGTIDPDITFLGFDITAAELCGGPGVSDAPEGYFVVIEESPGEPRLGLDVAVKDGLGDGAFEWDDLTWSHVAPDGDPDALSYVPVPPGGPPGVSAPPTTPFEWAKNGAHMAGITWQQPFRIAIHTSDMLPEDVCENQ